MAAVSLLPAEWHQAERLWEPLALGESVSSQWGAEGVPCVGYGTCFVGQNPGTQAKNTIAQSHLEGDYWGLPRLPATISVSGIWSQTFPEEQSCLLLCLSPVVNSAPSQAAAQAERNWVLRGGEGTIHASLSLCPEGLSLQAHMMSGDTEVV